MFKNICQVKYTCPPHFSKVSFLPDLHCCIVAAAAAAAEAGLDVITCSHPLSAVLQL